MSEITKWSATKTAAQIASKDISVQEVVSAHLERAKIVDDKLNLFTDINDDHSLALAKVLDDRRPDTLPLAYGVPMTTKSNVDQAGFANSNGVPAYASNMCDDDSAVVTNMKAAGGVIIARTNTPEFSMRWCTSNPLHGVSLNPWNQAITPGGSSGAAAAAIAANVGTIAHGNDLGGSLRYPAYCCGVATIRPSLGRVPSYNPCASAPRPPLTQLMSVQGPIARSVADVRLGLQMMAVGHGRDPLWNAAPPVNRSTKDSIKIGYSIDSFGDGVDPALEKAVMLAVDGFRDAGYEVIEVVPPSINRAAAVWGELLMGEVKSTLDATIRTNGSDEMQRLIDGYYSCFADLDLTGFINAMTERTIIQRDWAIMFEDIDILIMPPSGRAPFENDLDFKDPTAIPAMVTAQKYLFVPNLLGLPSVAMPTHLDDTVPGGAPSGVQLIAPMNEDYFALTIAEALESQLGTIIKQLDF